MEMNQGHDDYAGEMSPAPPPLEMMLWVGLKRGHDAWESVLAPLPLEMTLWEVLKQRRHDAWESVLANLPQEMTLWEVVKQGRHDAWVSVVPPPLEMLREADGLQEHGNVEELLWG